MNYTRTLLLVFALSFSAGYITAVFFDTTPQTNTANTVSNNEPRKALAPTTVTTETALQPTTVRSGHDVLASNLENLALPTLPATTSVADLSARIDSLPSALITSQLSYLFEDEYISTITDPHQFSKDLLGIALDIEPEETEASRLSIEFSLSPVYGSNPLNTDGSIEQYQAIFAHIISEQASLNVIIKWQNITTGEILLMRQNNLIQGQIKNGLFLSPSSGWKVGTYQVAVYDVSEDKKLLGNARYQLTQIFENSNAKDAIRNDVILDLLSAGRATAKQ